MSPKNSACTPHCAGPRIKPGKTLSPLFGVIFVLQGAAGAPPPAARNMNEGAPHCAQYKRQVPSDIVNLRSLAALSRLKVTAKRARKRPLKEGRQSPYSWTACITEIENLFWEMYCTAYVTFSNNITYLLSAPCIERPPRSGNRLPHRSSE